MRGLTRRDTRLQVFDLSFEKPFCGDFQCDYNAQHEADGTCQYDDCDYHCAPFDKGPFFVNRSSSSRLKNPVECWVSFPSFPQLRRVCAETPIYSAALLVSSSRGENLMRDLDFMAFDSPVFLAVGDSLVCVFYKGVIRDFLGSVFKGDDQFDGLAPRYDLHFFILFFLRNYTNFQHRTLR